MGLTLELRSGEGPLYSPGTPQRIANSNGGYRSRPRTLSRPIKLDKQTVRTTRVTTMNVRASWFRLNAKLGPQTDASPRWTDLTLHSPWLSSIAKGALPNPYLTCRDLFRPNLRHTSTATITSTYTLNTLARGGLSQLGELRVK